MRKKKLSWPAVGLLAFALMFPMNARADHLDGHTLDTRTTDVENEVMTPGQGLKQRVEVLEAQVAALEGDNTDLQPIIDLVNNCTVSVVTGTENSLSGPHFIISGCNVHVRSGSGTTGGTVNGTGNLIVGYNEAPATPSRGGSHNLIVGQKHNYSNYGGLVAGEENTVSGISASVSGGRFNTASGDWSSVSGGGGAAVADANIASGDYASASGGYHNEASGDKSSVSGGRENEAVGDYASVSGGYRNKAEDFGTSVSGGRDNRAIGVESSILGGSANIADDTALDSTISGGQDNRTCGNFSSISGGASNVTGRYVSSACVSGDGEHASVTGGKKNEANDEGTSVTGGWNNTASGSTGYSTVSGGLNRAVTGNWDWRAGSLFEDD